MTTSPVPSITEELLSELELHARQAVCDAITDGFHYDPRIGLTTIEENFCVAANPATIIALVEHIRSLQAALAQQPAPVNKSVIRDVFLRNGFTIKEGQTDLKLYVYAAAEELLSLDGKVVAAAPAAPVAVGQEPVAWMALNSSGFPEKCLPSDPNGFPVYRTPPAAEQPDTVKVSRELLERAMYAKDGRELVEANRELRALLAGGEKP